MHYNRRRFVRCALGCIAAPVLAHAREQNSIRLRLLVSGPAGGALDRVARLAADELRTLGYLPFVENHAGAGGQIAVQALAAAPADASTLLVTPPGVFTIQPHLRPHLAYRSSDFVGVGVLCGYEFGIAVGPASGAGTLRDFMAQAKSGVIGATYGSPGEGTEPHFMGYELARLTGAPMTHVPYRGGVPAIKDLVGGHLSAAIAAVPNLVAQHRAGKIRVLATTGRQRSIFLPDVPTMAEAGFPALTSTLFHGVFASARVPAETMVALSVSLARVTDSPLFREGLKSLSLDPLHLSPPALAVAMTSMSDRWAAVIRQSGFSPVT